MQYTPTMTECHETVPCLWCKAKYI